MLLPAAGRQGDVPEWPLSAMTARESVLWPEQWRRPQAIMWERNGQALEVALFVRALVDAEDQRATAAARTLVRQQMDSLGMTVPGLLRNRWRIVDEVEVEAEGSQAEQKPKRVAKSTKDRLKVVR